MRSVWRWIALAAPVLVAACGPAPYPPDNTRDSGVTVHMGGSISSFIGSGSSR